MTHPNFIKSNHIYIFASELSVLVGLNKYKNPSEVLLKLWRTNFKTEYQKIEKKMKDGSLQQALEENGQQKLERISKKYVDKTQKIKAELEKCQKSQNITEMKQSQQKMLDHCQDLEEKDKVEIQKAIYEVTNTHFGTVQENKSLHIYTQLTNQPVIKLSSFHKRPLIQSGDNIWFLGGKLDGILEDKTIIEVKNRMNGLFKSVREYEKIQTHAYMYIFHSNLSQIVETYMKGKNPECGILEVEFDKKFWKSIISRVLKFIHYFNKFLKNEKLQIKLLQQGSQQFQMGIF